MCHANGQAENWEVVEIVRCTDDVLVAHNQVSRMNFIPGGYTIRADVCDTRVQAES